MRAPRFERGAFFLGEVVTLIDANDAGAASRGVIENLFRYFEPDAETLEARGTRPSQVVQPPIRHARLRV